MPRKKEEGGPAAALLPRPGQGTPSCVENPSRMTRIRRALVAVVAALIVQISAPVAPPASASDGGGRNALGAVNVISGDSTGYVNVSLSRDVRISTDEPNRPGDSINADIIVTGKGRFVGIALVEDPYPGARNPERFFLAGRFGGCDRPGCRPSGSALETMYDLQQKAGETLLLKAGDYRLYLLADGAPVTAILRLAGLSGRRSFEVAGPAVLDYQTSPSHIDTDAAGGRIWSAGSSFAGGQVGFSLSWLEVEADDFTGMESGICQYNAFEPPPPEIGYGPHCSKLTPFLGAGGEFTFDSDIAQNRFTVLASFGYHDNSDGTTGAPNLSGQHGLGAWVRSPSHFEVLPLRSFFLTVE